MRIVFAGTPVFAAASLRAVADAGHDIPLVLTRPDRPAGRGMKLAASEVKQLALERGLPVFQPATLKDPQAQQRIREAGADAMIVAAYGLILPIPVLELFPYGCINIHASILPRWRGAAPIQRALLAGDAETGVSIMRMEAGLDTGPVYLVRSLEIAAGETAGSLHDKLAALGADTIVAALTDIASGKLTAQQQPEEGVTYAAKIAKEEAALSWVADAIELERKIRAYNPFPGASTTLRGEPLKIWRARLAEGNGNPGHILDAGPDRIVVACGRGALQLEELQRAGGKRMGAATFLHGSALAAGERLGA
ncbi:MAG TPA: methionyl-tRNA formyltransferase [Burkholderiales bacterium]